MLGWVGSEYVSEQGRLCLGLDTLHQGMIVIGDIKLLISLSEKLQHLWYYLLRP